MLDYFPHAPIIGHPKADPFLRRERSFMERYVQFFQEFFTECGVDRRLFSQLSKEGGSLRYASRRGLDIMVTEGDAAPGLPGWQVIETPGHAQSHIALYREADGVLIGGDHLLVHISPNPMMEPPAEGETERPKPLLQYNESLQKMLQYDIARSLNGHGDDATDIPSLVRERLDKQRQRAERVLEMVKERPHTVFDVCQKLFPTAYERQLMLTMSETIGQLDYLEANGYVTKNRKLADTFTKRWGVGVRLKGRHVVITGASGGIGEQIAYEAARQGGVPVLLARSEERLKAISARIEAETGIRAPYASLDVSDRGMIERLFPSSLRILARSMCWSTTPGLASFAMSRTSTWMKWRGCLPSTSSASSPVRRRCILI
ncbi:putative oxidoreductase YciK [Geobacillus sp. BCO2]|nr:putative oxidoreductase YciK [Geobacillus sp. BCO2]